MLWSFDSLRAYYTTGISLALFLVSRFYRNCYSVQSSLTPFFRLGQAFQLWLLSYIQLLRCFCFSSFIIEQKELLCINKMNLYFHGKNQGEEILVVRSLRLAEAKPVSSALAPAVEGKEWVCPSCLRRRFASIGQAEIPAGLTRRIMVLKG